MRYFKSYYFVVLVAAMMGISAFGTDAILPIFPIVGDLYNLKGENANSVQLLVYVFMFGFSLTQLAFGLLADFLGRKPILLLGLTIYTLASFAICFVNSFNGLLWIRFFQGIGLAAPRVLALAVVRDVMSGREMARVNSFAMMIFLLVPILAPYIGQIFTNFLGWQSVFYLFAFCGIVLMFSISRFLPETLPKPIRKKPNLVVILEMLKVSFTHRPTFIYMLIMSLMFSMMMIYIGQAEQIYGSVVYKLGDKFALAFAATALGMVFASYLNSRIVVRYSLHRIVYYALLFNLIADWTLLGISLISGGKPPFFVFLILMIIHMFFGNLCMPNINAIVLHPYHKTAGTVSAVIGTVMSILGLGIAHFVAGQFNGTVIPLALGFALILSTVFCLNLYVNKLTKPVKQ